MSRILSLFIIFSVCLFSKNNQPEVGSYPEAKIQIDQNTVINAKNLFADYYSIAFDNLETKRRDTLAYNDILYLSILEGTKAKEFGIYGFFVGFISGFIPIEDSYKYSDSWYESTIPRIVVFALAGYGLGALIGKFYPRWETYSFMPYFSINRVYDSNQLKFGLSLKL